MKAYSCAVLLVAAAAVVMVTASKTNFEDYGTAEGERESVCIEIP